MRTLIIDCNNVCYIARHAFGEDLSHDEEQTGVLWGFFNQLWRLAKQFETNRFLFAWDSRKSHRKLYYSGYKANRRQELSKEDRKSNDKVYAQFTTLRKIILPQFGFKNIYMHTGLEADDIIASLVLNNEWEEPPVLISTDKDLYQLLDHCDIWRPLPGEQKELMSLELFKKRYNMAPDLWVRVRALEGDTSDNLFGVDGVGSKIALKYLRGKLGPGKKRISIASPEGQKRMRRNITLMTLPHPKTPTFPIVGDEVFVVDEFLSICDHYNFNHFLKTENLRQWREIFHMEN